MSETRTAEAVRAELEAVEGRLWAFEMLAAVLEDWLLLAVSIVNGRLAGAIPGLIAMAEAGDRRAEQAAEEASEMLQLWQKLPPEFWEKRRGLSFALRQGLIPALQNRRYALQQELATLEPPETEPIGFWPRWKRGLLKFLDAWPAWWRLFAKET